MPPADPDRVAELVSEIERDGGEPLERLERAVELAAELGDTADALTDHFVTEARGAGHSWRDIGDTLGVSKQGAQQRFRSTTETGWGSAWEKLAHDVVAKVADVAMGKFDLARFTDRARKAVATARTESRRLGHDYVGTEHILLGIIDDIDSIATRALVALDAAPDTVRAAVFAAVPPGPPSPSMGRFTPPAKQALEGALKSALSLGHNYIGTEHLLLGLFAASRGVACEVLTNLGISETQARGKVVELLTDLMAGGG